MKYVNEQQGVSLVEAMMASAVLIFLTFAVLYSLSSNLTKSILVSDKVKMNDEIDKRVNEYLISGNFDDTKTDNLSFSKTHNDNIIEFKITSDINGHEISKKIFIKSGSSTSNDIV